MIKLKILRFQSTHPRRVWRQATYMHSHRYQFQSTHPRRVWHIANEENAREIFVSIHTPTKGVTQTFKPHRVTENVSIHTPTKGVTYYSRQAFLRQEVSIHTPTKGVTLRQTPYKHLLDLFQSTHPRRVWRYDSHFLNDWRKFQSTHPRRVWLHIQQIAEYHDAKIIILRKMAK